MLICSCRAHARSWILLVALSFHQGQVFPNALMSTQGHVLLFVRFFLASLCSRSASLCPVPDTSASAQPWSGHRLTPPLSHRLLCVVTVSCLEQDGSNSLEGSWLCWRLLTPTACPALLLTSSATGAQELHVPCRLCAACWVAHMSLVLDGKGAGKPSPSCCGGTLF